MPDNPAPAEIALSQFIASLLADVSKGIIAAQVDQERGLAELREATAMSVSEFSARYVTEEMVESELARLFPSEEPARPHAIFAAAPYQPKTSQKQESPNFRAVLGLTLRRSDYVVGRARTTLKTSAVRQVRTETRNLLSDSRVAALQEVVRRGLPTVIVDSGSISAKVILRTVPTEGGEEGSAKGTGSDAMAQPNALGVAIPETLRNVTINVRPSDERAPEFTQLNVDLLGEIEIRYKTIV